MPAVKGVEGGEGAVVVVVDGEDGGGLVSNKCTRRLVRSSGCGGVGSKES